MIMPVLREDSCKEEPKHVAVVCYMWISEIYGASYW